MGCGCLFSLLAIISPRLALLIVWLSTGMVNDAFDSFVLPFLGLIFLPFTTLFYVLVYDPVEISVWGWLFVIFGFLLDLGAYGGGGYTNRDRYSGYSRA